jgi:hypothetical protein
MVTVRTINVGGKRYLQVVEYITVGGKSKIKILKSFGPDNLTNRLKAEQFASNYDTFRSVAQREVQQSNIKLDDLMKGALVIFGLILGAKVIYDIIESITNSDD